MTVHRGMMPAHLHNLTYSCLQGGKMRMSKKDGQEYPPLLSEVQAVDPGFFMDLPAQQQMTCPANDTGCTRPDTSTFYALGSARFNLHVGGCCIHSWRFACSTRSLRQAHMHRAPVVGHHLPALGVAPCWLCLHCGLGTWVLSTPSWGHLLLQHNQVCDMLATESPGMSDDQARFRQSACSCAPYSGFPWWC